MSWLWTESQPGCQHRPVEGGAQPKGMWEGGEEAQLQFLLAQLMPLGIPLGWGRQRTVQSSKGMRRYHTAVLIQVTYGSMGTVEHSHHRRIYRFIHFPAIWGNKQAKWVQIPSCGLWVPRKPGHDIIRRKGDSNSYSLCNAVRNCHFSTQWGSFCF